MNALRRELAIETTILRLVIAVQFSMLAPKIVYTQQDVSAGHRPVVDAVDAPRHPLPKNVMSEEVR